MSTMTLKSNTAVNKKVGNSLKDRIVEYYKQNWRMITLGAYAASGRVPDPEMLRTLTTR